MELEDALRVSIGSTDIEVIDSDYVAESITLPSNRPILNLNALDFSDLLAKSSGGWDLIIDKSTADAISCGPLIGEVEPIHVLCENLGQVTKKGTRWISISYSPTRFSFLPTSGSEVSESEASGSEASGSEAKNGSGGDERKGEIGSTDIVNGEGEGTKGWKVIERKFLASTSLPEGRRWKDERGVERVVFEPETGVWGWVLERI